MSPAHDHPTPPPVAAALRRRFDAALVGLFVAALCLPLGGRLTGWAPPYDPGFEKRLAAAFPPFECRRYGPILLPRRGTLLTFPGMFEAYFNDQLGFRANLVQLYTQALGSGYIPPPLANASTAGGARGPVLVGRDGWLYLNGDCVDNYRNTRPFDEAELEAWIEALRRRRDWLARRNIRYLFFVAPDKATIYPEFLPRSITQVRPRSRLDQLLARLAEEPGLATFDLRPALAAAKSQAPVYYRIDSHWNHRGAWVGYQELCRALQAWYPALAPRSSADYRIFERGQRIGDLATMIPSPAWRESAFVEYVAEPPTQMTFYPAVFPLAPGRYADGVRSENPTAAGGRAFVFHDSFFSALNQFFGEHWRHAAYLSNGGAFPAELIEQERPDIVIDELVERKLLGPPPANPPALERVAPALEWAERISPRVVR